MAGSVDTQRLFLILVWQDNFFWCVGTVGGHRLRGFSVSVVVVVDEWGLLLCFWFAVAPSALSFVFFGLASFGLS